MPISTQPAGRDAVAWARTLKPYRQANPMRALGELGITLLGLLSLGYSLLWTVESQLFWLYAILLLPAAGFLVRLFMIQHDCAHRSFFRGRWANDLVGRLIGVATLTPHDHWRMSHTFHHASAGDLDRRGIGDVRTLTVAEYLECSRWDRLRYRLYRHPTVMFGVGPLYLFLLHNRLPMGFMRNGWLPWCSTMGTNLAIAIMLALLIATVGIRPFLWIYVPTVLIATVAGVWLFYVQHQFENTYWAKGKCWNAHDASLYGSSHYQLPVVVRWFTANIGMHHVHHLSSRIPFYRLPEVLRDHKALVDVGRVTPLASVRGVCLALWDEEQCRLVSFKELRSSPRPRSASEQDGGHRYAIKTAEPDSRPAPASDGGAHQS